MGTFRHIIRYGLSIIMILIGLIQGGEDPTSGTIFLGIGVILLFVSTIIHEDDY